MFGMRKIRRSEKILRKNSILKELPPLEREVAKNTVLLIHIIDNDLSHLWRWLLILALLMLGLYVKTFIGG